MSLEALDKAVEIAEQGMKKAVSHLEAELIKIRAGKANPQMVEGILVDYYGSPTQLNQVANVTIADARTLVLQPWEKTMVQPIEKAIMQANIGVTPQNDGTIIRLMLPPLTEERRKELVKKCNAEGENAKVVVRSVRRDQIEQIKKAQKDGLSEDAAKGGEAQVQGLTDKYIAAIDKHLETKEKEIMAV
jgi:ribosome recycling factor